MDISKPIYISLKSKLFPIKEKIDKAVMI